MRFSPFISVSAPTEGPEVYDQVIGFAELAEEPGFDGVWVPEHHRGHYGLRPSPLVVRSAKDTSTSIAHPPEAYVSEEHYHFELSAVFEHEATYPEQTVTVVEPNMRAFLDGRLEDFTNAVVV